MLESLLGKQPIKRLSIKKDFPAHEFSCEFRENPSDQLLCRTPLGSYFPTYLKQAPSKNFPESVFKILEHFFSKDYEWLIF